MLIKMGSHLSRDEIARKCEGGFTDEYKKKFEGTGINHARYAKNYQNAAGICKTCPNVVKSKLNTVTGEHCKLRFCDK